MSLQVTMMDSTGTLYRPNIGQGAAKGTTQVFAAVTGASNVPCSVQPASSSDRLLYGQRNVFISCTIFCLTDIGANVNDYFEVLDMNGNTHTYLIHGFNRGLNNRRSVPYSLNCAEVQPNRLPQVS